MAALNGIGYALEFVNIYNQINDFALLVNLVHGFDADGKPVFLRKLHHRFECFDQASEHVIHKQAEVVAEVENDVFGLQVTGIRLYRSDQLTGFVITCQDNFPICENYHITACSICY